jgi:hypothetical protein
MSNLTSAKLFPSFTGSVCLLSIALGFASCNGRGQYPDPTPATRVQADDIRADGQRRIDKIEADLAQQEHALDFRVTQTQTTAAHERDQIILDRDRENQPLMAQEADIQTTAERESKRIDDDLADQLKRIDGPEADRVRADAISRKAEIERRRTEEVANLTSKRDRAEAVAREKKATVDEREAKDLAALKAERENAQLKARADRLAVENDVSKQLNNVAEDSKKRINRTTDANTTKTSP